MHKHPLLMIGLLLLLPGLGPAISARAQETAPLPPPADSARLEEARKLLGERKPAEAEKIARALLDQVEANHGQRSLFEAGILAVLVRARANMNDLGPETLDWADRALSIEEEQHGPDALDLVPVLDLHVSLAFMARKTDRAVGILHRILAIKEAHLGPEHADVAATLMNLGWVLHQTRDYAGARPYFERAISIRETVLGPDHRELSQSCNQMGVMLTDAGSFNEAIPYLVRGLAILEKQKDTNPLDVAWTLTQLGNANFKAGHLEPAKANYQRALALKAEAWGPDHSQVGGAVLTAALVRYALAEYAHAETLFLRALSIQDANLKEDDPAFVQTLTNLGLLYSRTGNIDSAHRLYQRALTIAEDAYGKDDLTVAWILNNLAILKKATGEYREARQLYERVLETRRKQLGADHPDVAHTMTALGSLLQNAGNYDDAIRLYEQALEISLARLDPGHIVTSLTRNNLGTALAKTGDKGRARSLYEETIRENSKSLGPDHRDNAPFHYNLADLLVGMGDYDEAEHHANRALAIWEKTVGPEYHQVSRPLMVLARIQERKGTLDEAVRLVNRAISVQENAFGSDHPHIAHAYQRLAEIQMTRGRAGEAITAALRAERIARDHLALTARTLAEREALRYAAARASGLDVAQSLCSGDLEPQDLARVWDGIIRSRALVFDEMSERHRATGEVAEKGLRQVLDAARRRLANLTVRGRGELEAEEYRALLEDARREKEDAERALAETSASFRDRQEQARLGFSDVAEALPPRSALVALSRFRSYPDDTEKYLALVLRRDHPPAVVDLGPAAAIDSMAMAWRAEVGRPPRPDPGGEVPPHLELGTAFRERVWDPATRDLADVEQIFLVPDGVFHLINMAALPRDRFRYLVEEGPGIHVLNTERDLVSLARPPTMGTGLLVLGDPDYDSVSGPMAESSETGNNELVYRGQRAGCVGFQDFHWDRLPGTAREIQETMKLWDAHRSAGKSVDLTGKAATEAAFKQHAPGKRTLHLATHGFFLGARCPSALEGSRAISGISPRHVDEPPPPVTGENPLHLSGLVLAGANYRQQVGPDEEDGILTAEEVAALDLDGVEWAVLSACQTGIGEIQAGEGVFGLRRTFQIAGARTVIVSLWEVEDQAAQEWMRNLYEGRLVAGLGTAPAVRAASVKVLEARRARGQSTHPFYWAAFVAAGDWK